MPAEDALRAGDLEKALSALQQQVRDDPSNAKYRNFLFQLLAVRGDWDRALTQLNVAGEMDATAGPMVQAYREALACEVLRAEIFAGKRTPLVFGEPESWLALLTESLRLWGEGETTESSALREQALEEAPTTSGTIKTVGDEGKTGGDEGPTDSFSWIADADSRLGPVLEAIINGRYYWVPFHRIQRIDVEPPEDLRDVVWMPAHFQWSNGGELVGFIPTRYPGSETNDDGLIKLSRKTEWSEREGGVFEGLGQRILATDTGEYSLMDIRQVLLDTADAGTGDESTAGAEDAPGTGAESPEAKELPDG